MGVVGIIPQGERPQDNWIEAGFSLDYKSFIMLILDIGTDYDDDITKNSLYRAATQLKVFQDFFIRVGLFEDKGEQSKGNGAGISWVQPRLVLDFAIKNTEYFADKESGQESETLRDSSFSLSYRF